MTFDQFMGKEESPVSFARRLKAEIDSWRPYAEALRKEDREVFREMLNAVAASYIQAIDRAERGILILLGDEAESMNLESEKTFSFYGDHSKCWKGSWSLRIQHSASDKGQHSAI